MKNFLLFLISISLIFNCTEENIPENDIVYNNDNIITPPNDTLTIISYNVFEGAGTSEGAANVRSKYGFKPNALSDVIRFLQYYNPDIIGIQEAVRWEANNDSIARYVSEKLHMEYILAPGWYPEWNVMLLTKYEIIDYELYSAHFRIGALKARLKTEYEDTLTVYNFHLSGPEHDKDLKAFNNLKGNFENTKYGIAMGDFNEPEISVPFPENWRLLATGYNIDQIWATLETGLSESGEYYKRVIFPDIREFTLDEISDHMPVICKLGLY